MANKKTVRRLIWLAVLVCFGLSCRQAYVWLTTPRESAVRAGVAANCKGILIGIAAVKNEKGRLPTSFDELVEMGVAGPKTVEDFIYTGGRQGVLFYQRVPSRAVKKGEWWGEPGGHAVEDIPAVRFFGVVDSPDVQMMNEPEFSQKYAALLTGTPTTEPAAQAVSKPTRLE